MLSFFLDHPWMFFFWPTKLPAKVYMNIHELAKPSQTHETVLSKDINWCQKSQQKSCWIQASGGHVVNVASVAGQAGRQGLIRVRKRIQPHFFGPEIDEYKASTWLVLRHGFTRLEPYMISSKPPLSYVGFSHIPMVKSPHLPVAHRGTLPSCRYLLPLSMQRPRWDEIPKELSFFLSDDNDTPTGWCPPVISWFIHPINYSYINHKPQLWEL